MVKYRHVLALLKAEPGVTEIAGDIDSDDTIVFFNDIPVKSEDESLEDYKARLTDDQLSRATTGGLTLGTYSLLVKLGCAFFENDCEGFENEYMVCLPTSDEE